MTFLDLYTTLGGAMILFLIIILAGMFMDRKVYVKEYRKPDSNRDKGLHISKVFPTSKKMESVDAKDMINKFKGNID